MVTTSKNRSERWRALSVVWIHQTSVWFLLSALPPIAPLIQVSLGLTRTQFGLLVASQSIGTATVAIFSGRLADRLGTGRILLIGPWLTGLTMIGLSQSNSLAVGLLFSILFGFASSYLAPSTTKAVLQWFVPRQRATAMGIKQTGVTIGGMLAAGVLPIIALSQGWRFALVILSLLILSISMTAALLYPTSSVGDRVGKMDGESWFDLLRKVSKNTSFLVLCGFTAAFAIISSSLTTFLVLYLVEVQSLTLVLADLLLASVYVSGTLGRIILGLVSDRFTYMGRKNTLIIFGGITSILYLFLTLIPPQTGFLLLLPLVFFLGFSTLGYQAVVLTFAGELVGYALSGLAIGFILLSVNLGSIVGISIFGSMVDLTGVYTYSWLTLSLIAATTTISLAKLVRR